MKENRSLCNKCSYFEEGIEEYLSQRLRAGKMVITGADPERRLQTLYCNCKQESNVIIFQ